MKSHIQSAVKFGPRRRWIALAPLFLINLASISRAYTQVVPAISPSDIEAAYLYNFGKFIDWPPADTDALTNQFSICIVGKDEFGPALDAIVQSDTVKGRTIVVKRLQSIPFTDSCQILFLASSEKAHLTRDLDALKEKPILTVSSMPGFLDRGGMIQFIVQDNRVRFAVSLAAATHVHLTFSSQLLKVAVYVNSNPAQEGQ
jgi:YfiR/HmsC-like